MLKEENEELKKQIEALSVKISSGPSANLSEEEKAQFEKLREMYEANSKQALEIEKTFEEKVEEAKLNEDVSIGSRVDISKPHLIVLNEDAQITHKLKYSLEELPVSVGRKHANPTPKIVLSGIGIKVNHAEFIDRNGTIYLKRQDLESGRNIMVNGQVMDGIENEKALSHFDVVTFGLNCIMLFAEKSDGEDIFEIQWESVQLSNEEERLKRQNVVDQEKEKLLASKMNIMVNEMEARYKEEKTNLQAGYEETIKKYEDEIRQLTEKKLEMSIDEEKLKIEKTIEERMKIIEVEKARKKRENEQKKRLQMKEKLSKDEDDEQFKNVELILGSLLKRLYRMKSYIAELDLPFEVDPVLYRMPSDDFDSEMNMETPLLAVRIKNRSAGSVYYWNTDKFNVKYELIKKLARTGSFEGKGSPLEDEAKPIMIGFVVLLLQPLLYLQSNEYELPIIGLDGEVQGLLEVALVPFDDKENEFEEYPEDPSELIAQPLNFKISVLNVKQLKDKYSGGFYVEYVSFTDNLCYSTRTYEGKKEFSINEEFKHRLEYISKEDIQFMKEEKIILKVFSNEITEIKEIDHSNFDVAKQVQKDLDCDEKCGVF